MKTTRIMALAGLLLAVAQSPAQVSITTGGSYSENFDALASAGGSWADNSTLSGWYAGITNIGTLTFTTPATFTATSGGASSSTTLYGIRSTGSTDYALGGIPSSGAGRVLLAWRLLNNDSVAITNLVVTYDGEEWKSSSPINSYVGVSYQIFNAGAGSLAEMGGWTDAPASLTFVPPVTGSATIDGNDPANRVAGLTASITGINLLPGQEIWFRWYFVKLGGGSFMLGVDNASVSVPVGQPPVIGTIPDVSVAVGATSVTNTFTVSDVEDDATSTPLPAPTASSSNEAVVPSANVFFEGTGSTRSVYVVAGATIGNAIITVHITDSDGNIGQQTFTVTVLPADQTPVISTPPPTNTLVNTSVTVPFTVGDAETAASSLTVTGWVASYSSTILATVETAADATGTNRTVTVTPVNGAYGVGVVHLSVDDGVNTNSTSFAVMVRSAANVVFNDYFDYPDDSKLFDFAGGLWTLRGSDQSVNLMTGTGGTLFIRETTTGDAGVAPLAGAPFTVQSGAILYLSCNATWIDDGSGRIYPTNSNGGIISLANNATSSSAIVSELSTTTNTAPEGTFRLGLKDTDGVVQINTSVDLPMPGGLGEANAAVVTRYDLGSGKCRLWINATSENDPSVESMDVSSPVNISYIVFRQSTGMGRSYFDNIKVVVMYKPLLTDVTPPAAGNVDVFFTGNPGDTVADFEVEQAATITSTFNNVAASIEALPDNKFKATVSASGNQNFYRVKRKPLVF